MGNQIRIIPSIASANQLKIEEEIQRLGNWKQLHIDIEDGNFVPNITFGEKMIRGIANIAKQELDVHILANNPEWYFQMLKECAVKRIAVHFETLKYPLDTIGKIHKLGMKAGLAMNFATKAEDVAMFSNSFDYVIVMTAEPDSEEQHFYQPMLRKIRQLRKILPLNKEIWVDGGIGRDELPLIMEAGADTVIMGRAVFGNQNPQKVLREMSVTEITNIGKEE